MCPITGDKIRENINSRLELLSKAYGINIKDGVSIDSRNTDELANIEMELARIEADYGSLGMVYDIKNGFGNVKRLEIRIKSNDLLEKSYAQMLQGQTTDMDKLNYDNIDYSKLSIDSLRKSFEEKSKKLRDFVGESAIILEKSVLKQKDLKKLLYKNIDAETIGRLRNIKTKLEEAQMNLENQEDRILAFGDYLTEVNVLAKTLKDITNELKNDPESFIKINELAPLIMGHKKVILDLHNFLKDGNRSNSVVSNVLDSMSSIETIENNWVEAAEIHGIAKLEQRFTPIAKEMRDKVEKRIGDLNALKEKNAGNESMLSSIDKRIEKNQKLYDEFAPTKENLLATLRGDRGDISKFNSYFRSAITNPDLIISGLVAGYKDAIGKIKIAINGKKNEFQKELDEYLQETGEVFNTETKFDNLLTQRTIWYYDKKDKELKEKQTYQFKNGFDPKFFTDHSLAKAKLTQAKDDKRIAQNNLTDFRVTNNLVGLKDSEIENEEFKLLKGIYLQSNEKLHIAEKELRNWERTHLKNQFNKDWYAPDVEYLEKYAYLEDGNLVITDTVSKGKDYTYIYDYYNQYRSDLKNVKYEIKREENGIPSIEQAERLQELLSKKIDLRNKNSHIPGSFEAKLAEHLLEYYELKKVMYENEVTPESEVLFNAEKSKIDKLYEDSKLSLELKERWYDFNTKRKLDPEYYQRLDEINKQINKVYENIYKVLGREPDGDSDILWGEIRAIGLKYRDRFGKINGTRLSTSERDLVEELEKKIEDIKKNLPDFRNRPSEIKAEIDRLRLAKQDAYNKGLKEVAKSFQEQINDINEDYPMNKTVEDNLSRLSTLYEEKSQLTKGSETKYYKAEYDKQLFIYLNEKGIEPVPEYFEYSDSVYERQIDGSYTIDGDPFLGDIDLVYARTFESSFRDSDWYKANHIEIVKVVKSEDGAYVEKTEYKPIYIWRETNPIDENYIIDNYPNYGWSEFKPNDRYLNNTNSIDLDGMSEVYQFLPSEDSSYRNYNSGMNAAETKYNNFLRKEYYKYQQIYPGKNGNMGDIIPAIERDFNVFDLTSSDKNKEILKEKFLRTWKTNEQDKDVELGDTSGNVAQFLPVFFTGNIDVGLVSKNVHSTILKFVQSSMHHEIVSEEVLPDFEAVELVLSQDKNRPKLKSEDALINNYLGRLPDKVAGMLGIQRKVAKKRAGNNRLAQLQGIKEMYLYGVRNIKTDDKFLGTNTRWDKIFHNVLGIKSLSALGVNPLSGWGYASQVGNWLAANTNQWVKASIKNGNATFDKKELLKAYKDFPNYATQLISDVGKTGHKSKFGQLLDVFGVFDEGLKDDLGEEITSRSNVRKVFNSNVFFFMKNGTEIMIGSTTALATMRSHYIKDDLGNLIVDSDGKPINVEDAYKIVNNNLQLREDLYDAEGNITKWSEYDYNRFRGHLQRVRRDIDGAYSTLDKSLIQRHWFGSALFWMKRWLVPFLENMYSVRRFNYEEGTYIRGYMIEGFRAQWEVLGYLLNKDTRSLNFIKSSLDPEQKDALRQMYTLYGMVLTIYMILSMGFGYDDDDKDRFKKMKKRQPFFNWALYGILKGQGEAESLVFPFGMDEISKTVSDPVPQLIPMYRDVNKIIWKDMNWSNLFSEDDLFKRYKSDSGYAEKGDIKSLVDFYKMLGWTNSKSSAIDAIKGREFLKR